MGLADTARKAREESEHAGYRFLKELRRMGDTYSKQSVNEKWMQVARFDQTAESLTLDGRAKICRMMAEAREMDEIGMFCRAIVKEAERREREKKGGAARIDIAGVEGKIEAIRRKWQEEKELQIRLVDSEKGGGADERVDEGNESDPAGMFQVEDANKRLEEGERETSEDA